MANAKMARIASAADFVNTVKRESFTHLIYYGHALWGTNALLPSMGKNISGWGKSGDPSGSRFNLKLEVPVEVIALPAV
jgi:hypothetical protein